MAEQTAISWCDCTANLWIGCQKVSPACDHCYAEDLMGTQGSRLKRVEWGPRGERQFCKLGWTDIKKWQRRANENRGRDPDLGRRRRIFVNSLSDFFDTHPSVKWRGDAWHLIRRCPDLIFIILTKRPHLIARYLPPFWDEIAERVWLMTTAENQEWANRRVPELLASCYGLRQPAVFGVSVEPMLGPVDLETIELRAHEAAHNDLSRMLGDYIRPLSGCFTDSPRLGWVIVGGESGKHARPMDPAWALALRDQCALARVPFHFKQWGEWAPAVGTREGDVIYRHPHPDYPGEATVGIGTTVRRIGKKEAGRKLRGLEYLEFPNAA
jgi:protein gp37